MKPFTLIPFFRILIPFCIGILLKLNLSIATIHLYYLIPLFVCLTFFNFYSAGTKRYKRLFIISADLFLFLIGIYLVQVKDQRTQADFYGNCIKGDSLNKVIVVLDELPSVKNERTKCHIQLMSLLHEGRFKFVKGSSIAYIQLKPHTLPLKAGQCLLLNARFVLVPGPQNPEEFNYQKYLATKQVFHTLFVDSNSYAIIQTKNSALNPIWQIGLACKSSILNSLKNSELSQNAFSICSALITGYDQEIEKPVMEAFSHSGTLHVLSVSGLHTGLIYLMLTYILDVFDKKRRYKLLRFLIVTLVLWAFALITGFSAPVLRAVIMFNLLGAGKIFFRNQLKNQLNILCVSAFILLVFNPFFILDVGFQLSYLAMFGLIYFQPKFVAIWQTENKWRKYLWQSVSASFAATLTTLPITLFYFKQLPLWFFVCNIVVVPATFVLLLGTILLVFQLKFLAVIINVLVKLLLSFIILFNQNGITFIDAIHFTWIDSLFLSLVLILFSICISSRSYTYFRMSLMLLLVWQVLSISSSLIIKNRSLLCIYQLKKHSAIALKNKKSLFYQLNNESVFNYSIKPHFISLNYPTILKQNFNCIVTPSEAFVILNTNNKIPILSQSKNTTLVLMNNFKLKEEDLEAFPNLTRIICDGSNNKSSSYFAAKLSRKFGLKYYDTKQTGAYLLTLK